MLWKKLRKSLPCRAHKLLVISQIQSEFIETSYKLRHEIMKTRFEFNKHVLRARNGGVYPLVLYLLFPWEAREQPKKFAFHVSMWVTSSSHFSELLIYLFSEILAIWNVNFHNCFITISSGLKCHIWSLHKSPSVVAK